MNNSSINFQFNANIILSLNTSNHFDLISRPEGGIGVSIGL